MARAGFLRGGARPSRVAGLEPPTGYGGGHPPPARTPARGDLGEGSQSRSPPRPAGGSGPKGSGGVRDGTRRGRDLPRPGPAGGLPHPFAPAAPPGSAPTPPEDRRDPHRLRRRIRSRGAPDGRADGSLGGRR